MKTKILLYASCVVLLAVTGCNTVKMEVRIDSAPTDARDAEVVMADDKMGPWIDVDEKVGKRVPRHTPTEFSFKMKRGQELWVKARKEGFEDSPEARIWASPEGPKDQSTDVRLQLKPHESEKPQVDGLHSDIRPAPAPGTPAKPTGSARVWVESAPKGAQVLVAESADGEYHPWRQAVGEPITPVRGVVPVGDTFWVKVKKGRQESAAQYVHVESRLDMTVSFDLDKGKDEAGQKAILEVRSTPAGATVLVSTTEFGVFHPWPPGAKSKVTPMEVEVDVGSQFWLKIRKDKYRTSEPQFIKIDKGERTIVNVSLSQWLSCVPPEPYYRLPEPQVFCSVSEGAVEVVGYAQLGRDVAASRKAAILDALGNAVQQKFGTRVTATSVANNFVLQEDRVAASTEGAVESYDIVEQNNEDGLFRIVLRVRFKPDAQALLRGKNLTFLVGGIDTAAAEVGSLPGLSARDFVASALRKSSVDVTIKKDTEPSPAALTLLAGDSSQVKYQSDMVLFMDSETELYDKFGSYYTCKTTVEYQLLQPTSPSPFIPADFTSVISSGIVEGMNKKKRAHSAKDAAKYAMEEAGAKVAAQVLEEVAALYDGVVSHELYIVGFLNQRERQAVAEELREIDGVRCVRYLPFSQADSSDPNEDLHQYLIHLTPDVRTRIPDKIQRLVETDVDVVETDLYNTVVKLRKPPVEEIK